MTCCGNEPVSGPGDCCGGPAQKPPTSDDCCGGKPATSNDCCDGSDDCCGGKPATSDDGCGGGGCCDSTPSSVAELKADGDAGVYCSEDARCDETCIKAAAALECSMACADQQDVCCSDTNADGNEKSTCHDGCNSTGPDILDPKLKDHVPLNATHDHAHGEDGKHSDEPCNVHLTAAMEKYAAYLESARCICRSILASASRVESCCQKPSSGGVTASSTSCCPKPASSGSTAFSTSRSRHLDLKDREFLLSRRCLKERSVRTASAQPEPKCCDGRQNLDAITRKPKATAKVTSVDIEKAAGLSHVLLKVTGMDCSGCANNLTRALEDVAGTENVRVIFISGTAEFDLDTEINTLVNVIRRAHQATRYKLTPITSDSQSIDVTMSVTEAIKFRDNLPPGVERCEKLSKTTYEIGYDPCIIGARDMLAGIDAQLGPPRSDSLVDKGKQRLIRVFALTIAAFLLTTPVVVLEWGRPSGVSEHTTLIVAVILATMVQAIGVSEFYIPALSSLVYNKVVEMDMLVVISITAAYLYSIIATGFFFAGIELETRPFFETSTLLVTLILLGRLLAAWARRRAVKAVSVKSLQASTAMLIDHRTGEASEIDARLLQYGDSIAILPHSRIVTDADVLEGTSEVDESMLTGESLPVLKTAGKSLVSGTVNGGGRLVARVSRLPGRNTITDIANLVEQAQGFKPRVQDLADKVAGYFIPVVCTAALIVLVIWVVVTLKVRKQPAGEAIGSAIGYCIAVLAISCPCALGLAVPMVLVVAGGVAARAGVIIKTADVIERGFKVTDVVFDKTGTLTEPTLDVVREVIIPTHQASEDVVLSIVMAMTKSNEHPVSGAVAKSLETRGIRNIDISGLTSIPGCGVEAQWQGLRIRAGNAKWLNVGDTPQVLDFAAQGLTMLCVMIGNHQAALFGLKAHLREGATGVVQELQRRKIAVHIVSGDARRVVESVATEIGVPRENVAAERTPAQKQEYVRQLMEAGKITLFCGDGTNDAVAVAQAHVGVQIESSSDVTRATADVVLLHNLDGVVSLLDVSKAAFRRITFNFIWSAVYNVLAILLAAGAFVKFRIPPAYAGLGEMVSVLPVIIAALTQPKVKARM
ncbi:copper-translocating P-type ATPase [Phialophora macrospora]|uniref:Copper-translocating P-type ATPase n=1 Tax=Phialophora macrospora TaxID=1851006 RepID=A0A0D2CYJ6_9EURO|nr:copper-translocating P-type ATPase [Phialophora macrospora]